MIQHIVYDMRSNVTLGLEDVVLRASGRRVIGPELQKHTSDHNLALA